MKAYNQQTVNNLCSTVEHYKGCQRFKSIGKWVEGCKRIHWESQQYINYVILNFGKRLGEGAVDFTHEKESFYTQPH